MKPTLFALAFLAAATACLIGVICADLEARRDREPAAQPPAEPASAPAVEPATESAPPVQDPVAEPAVKA